VGAVTLPACVIGPTEDDEGVGFGGRGSRDCQRWQEAFCDYDARCGATYDCQEEIRGIACESDNRAERCAEELPDAACDDPPSNCAVEDLVDPAPARAMCRTFVRDLCDVSEACGQSRDQCVAEAERDLNCAVMDGVAPRYDSCAGELQSEGCSLFELPSSCRNVFKDLL
jgi:hypothetical protein